MSVCWAYPPKNSSFDWFQVVCSARASLCSSVCGKLLCKYCQPPTCVCVRGVFLSCCVLMLKKKRKKYPLIDRLSSVLSWSSFGSLQSSWVWRHKLYVDFSAEAVKLRLLGWGSSGGCFQVSPQMFGRVKFWALMGPLRDIRKRRHGPWSYKDVWHYLCAYFHSTTRP